MGWFGSKKPEKKTLKMIAEILGMIEVKIAKLEAEVELINGKLRKRIYKEENNPTENSKGTISKGSKGYNDGFDDLREIAE